MERGCSGSSDELPDELPVSTDVMFARIDGNVEVGISLCGTDPGSVETESSGRPRPREKVGVILKEIDECFAGIRRGERMLRAFRLHVELGVDGAATGRGGGPNFGALGGCSA